MPRSMRIKPLFAAAVALVSVSVLTSGCSRIRFHNGYIGEQVLVDSIQPGVDNRASVEASLGRPTFTSQFTAGQETPTWYYVSRDTRQLAFARPSPVAQNILAVRFDANGAVRAVDQIGMDQIASIDPYGQITPTLGRERGFFSQLFGNIGSAGQAGQAGGTADNPGGQ